MWYHAYPSTSQCVWQVSYAQQLCKLCASQHPVLLHLWGTAGAMSTSNDTKLVCFYSNNVHRRHMVHVCCWLLELLAVVSNRPQDLHSQTCEQQKVCKTIVEVHVSAHQQLHLYTKNVQKCFRLNGQALHYPDFSASMTAKCLLIQPAFATTPLLLHKTRLAPLTRHSSTCNCNSPAGRDQTLPTCSSSPHIIIWVLKPAGLKVDKRLLYLTLQCTSSFAVIASLSFSAIPGLHMLLTAKLIQHCTVTSP